MRALEDKTAFITGGASGLGYGMARAFAKAGMKLALADIDADGVARAAKALSQEGAQAIAITLDVREPESWAKGAERCESLCGPVSLLCCNAGVIAYGGFRELSLEAWRFTLSTNLDSVFLGLRTFLPRMAGREGHIVLTASAAGLAAVPGLPAYTASKYGVVALAETLRLELAGTSLDVSVLCPGYVPTALRANSERLKPPASIVLPANNQRPPGFEHAIDADSVGQLVLDAVLTNRFWILTHVEIGDSVRQRSEELMQSFADLECKTRI